MSLRLSVALVGLFALPVFCASAGAADSTAPDYTVVSLQVQVNRPADQVWKRVSDYCAISEWLKTTCHYSSGSGDVGTVRVVNDTTIEPMVAKTAWSYTYTQTAGSVAANSYHGTVAIEPDGPGKSILKYTLFYNQAMFDSEAKRSAERARITTRFQAALDAMKAVAEAKQ